MNHIIIVEDDSGILEPMTIILETAGYQVTGFADGRSILSNNFILPNLFIFDRQLPGVDGLDLCRHLKSLEHTRHIPVIIISASSAIERLAIDAGADAVLEKPFKTKELRDLIARQLSG